MSNELPSTDPTFPGSAHELRINPQSMVARPEVEQPAAEALPQSPPLKVMALHALMYCERLFYLEEVEGIYIADANVYAGRRLHDDLAGDDDLTPEKREFHVASEAWGLIGKADAIRKRNGSWIVYEHKKGRCRRILPAGEKPFRSRTKKGSPASWPSDRIQAIAYSVLISEALGERIAEARIRYHADNVTASISVDDKAVADLRTAILRARELERFEHRPPVTEKEYLCKTCSLAPVCLPEEERGYSEQLQLFPTRRSGETLHVVSPKARIGRSANTVTVTIDDEKQKVPVGDLDSVVIHGSGQISTQAMHLLSSRGIPVQWYSGGGRFMAGTQSVSGRVRQRIRQFNALTDEQLCLRLTRITISAKVESQLRYLMRATRGNENKRRPVEKHLDRLREVLSRLPATDTLDSVRGLEGQAAKAYFAVLPNLISSQAHVSLIPKGRTKHPPRDRFNCLLSYAYSLLFGLVHRSLIAVGLEPAFGYFHQPRSTAPPLVSDVMELFRTAIVDIAIIGSVNRNMWNSTGVFAETSDKIWLTSEGKKQAIQLFEQRLSETFKHPHTGTSMEYSRIVELECRLLEKEWSGFPGEFGQMRLR